MRIIDCRTDSVHACRNDVLVANENENGISLERLRYPALESETIRKFDGGKCTCLTKLQDSYFISIDNALYASKDLVKWKIVLSLQPDNFIWHMCVMQSWLIAQEYGKPPTYLYRSQNGLEWERIISNKQVDRTSRHWHSIAYDNRLNCLYATLGDSNVTRVIKLEDNFSWKALYIGPWQFVPIVVLKDKAVFGMDSSLVPGGIGIYRSDVGWEFRFLRWNDRDIKLGQACDLKLLSNGLWIAALGSPTAILVSKDLERWALAAFDGTSCDFNRYMNIGEGNDYAAISTGKKLLVFRKNELENLADEEPFVTSYSAFKERLVGHIRISKRRLWQIVTLHR